MYLQIENEFKKNSKTRTSQLLFVVGVVILSIICTTILDIIKVAENYASVYAVILLVGMFIFYIICYVIMFFIGISKGKRTIKSFFQIQTTIQAYQKRIHDEDIKILKKFWKNI